MSGKVDPASFLTVNLADLRQRLIRIEQIRDGALPEADELLTGLPMCRDDLQSDVMTYIDRWRLSVMTLTTGACRCALLGNWPVQPRMSR